eukprot:5670766-Amphidinium_carterae.1
MCFETLNALKQLAFAYPLQGTYCLQLDLLIGPCQSVSLGVLRSHVRYCLQSITGQALRIGLNSISRRKLYPRLTCHCYASQSVHTPAEFGCCHRCWLSRLMSMIGNILR